ncbi:OmpH family outer membrane protein [Dysgonomonas massiliensis]|uniref:OmpH family outer membrane protein n=1 Tax=Dysgonomonas massiliensis TaxID=2040292 RepID=UPI000C77AACA|nr:OmpH family outer membrane protein [Dysgonomonas massiliensis]
MLKKLFVLLLVLAPVAAFAQDKIAYISAQEIFTKMPEMSEVETALAKKREDVQKQMAALEKQYQETLERYQKDTTQLSESILMDRQKEIQSLEERYRTFVEKSQVEFEQEQQKLLAPLQQKMMNAIKTVGDENGYTYIISREALLYTSSSAIDASAKVKAKLNIKD